MINRIDIFAVGKIRGFPDQMGPIKSERDDMAHALVIQSQIFSEIAYMKNLGTDEVDKQGRYHPKK